TGSSSRAAARRSRNEPAARSHRAQGRLAAALRGAARRARPRGRQYRATLGVRRSRGAHGETLAAQSRRHRARRRGARRDWAETHWALREHVRALREPVRGRGFGRAAHAHAIALLSAASRALEYSCGLDHIRGLEMALNEYSLTLR